MNHTLLPIALLLFANAAVARTTVKQVEDGLKVVYKQCETARQEVVRVQEDRILSSHDALPFLNVVYKVNVACTDGSFYAKRMKKLGRTERARFIASVYPASVALDEMLITDINKLRIKQTQDRLRVAFLAVQVEMDKVLHLIGAK